MGLASSGHIVERHAGSIHVDTCEGHGRTFTARVPLTFPGGKRAYDQGAHERH